MKRVGRRTGHLLDDVGHEIELRLEAGGAQTPTRIEDENDVLRHFDRHRPGRRERRQNQKKRGNHALHKFDLF
jgi:hypothetical protein